MTGGISCHVSRRDISCGITLKVSIALPVTSKHDCDMTERLLKVTLPVNPILTVENDVKHE